MPEKAGAFDNKTLPPHRKTTGRAEVLFVLRRSIDGLDRVDVVRGGLVDKVVEPVHVQEIGVGSPGDDRLLRRIVIREVVLGDIGVDALLQIAEILVFQRVRVVLGVAGDEDLPPAFRGRGVEPGPLGHGEDLELVAGHHVLQRDRGVAGVGNHKALVKAAHQHGGAPYHPMGIHARELFRQRDLLDPVVVEERGLGRPADVEGAVHVGLAPLHDPAELIPVFHLLKVQLLHRRAGDDHAVEIAVLYVLKIRVELEHVFLRGVFAHIGAGLHELQLHLQGRVAQQTGELGLRRNLGGHEIQQQNLQRADILRHGPVFGHDKDVFVFQYIGCGEQIRYFDRHIALPLLRESVIRDRGPG